MDASKKDCNYLGLTATEYTEGALKERLAQKDYEIMSINCSNVRDPTS
jgi:hypothetical protein